MTSLRRKARRLRLRRKAVSSEVARFLRTEQIGGLILLGAAALALIVANSPLKGWYQTISETVIGPSALHLNLTLATWAQDGLLAVFFVVAGLELKRELVVGELRSPRQAMLPIWGAVGGMIIPALVCLAVAWGAPGGKDAWPIPVATDIAFALAVLAITARDLPSGLRVFLLSLAIVDDLGAILLIAVLFTSHISVLALLGAAGVIGVYVVLQRFRVRGWWIYLLLALLAWLLVHESGIHATIAGVAIGFATRVKRDPDERHSPAELLEHRLQPISAGICVPLFAFFAAGIPFSFGAIGAMLGDRAALGVLAGLLAGKTIGVLGGAVVAVRTGLAKLPESLHWLDMGAVAVLTGCGFTVSLLMAGLAFPEGTQQDSIKAAVLVGSLTASLLAAALLRRRARAHTS